MASYNITEKTTIAELMAMAKTENFKSVSINFDDGGTSETIKTLAV